MKTWLACLILLILGNHSLQTDNCVLKKDADNILVYTCKAHGKRFKSLKATFTISNTTIDELVAFLKRVEDFPKWQYNMRSAKTLRQVSDSVAIVRSELDTPWPVENRELIVQYSFEKHPQDKMLKVTTKTIVYDYPFSDEFVRVPYSLAEWSVTTVGNALQVSYKMEIDPGGSLPAWLVNMAMAEGPHQTFTNLKKLLEN
jgi:hypothetical protein